MRYLIAPLAAIAMTSCGRPPKIDYQNKVDTVSRMEDRMRDTTKVLVSSLPIKFDSTDLLLFPVGFIDIGDRGKGYAKLRSAYGSDSQIASSYFNTDQLSGNFVNIVFQEINGDERKLTDKKINIANIEFLRSIYKGTKSAYLLYTVFDRDSNNDGELNYLDLASLYISRIDGTEFKKVTKELHQLYDHRVIQGLNRIYFRTQEDVNKDGELDKTDKFHHYRIDFRSNGFHVSEFDPLNLFK